MYELKESGLGYCPKGFQFRRENFLMSTVRKAMSARAREKTKLEHGRGRLIPEAEEWKPGQTLNILSTQRWENYLDYLGQHGVVYVCL